jgi:chromosome segregation ATPase
VKELYNELPQLLQLAAGMGLAMGVMIGVSLVIWVRLGSPAKKIDAHTDQIATVEALQKTMQKNFDEKLTKEIDAAREAFKTQGNLDKDEFGKQLRAVAENFADRQTQHNTTLAEKDALIKTESDARHTAETERDDLKATLVNLNKRLEDIESDLKAQKVEIEALHKTIDEKNKKERELGDLLKAFKDEVAALSDEKVLLQAEKNAMLEMARAVGLKLATLEEKKSQIEEINPA